MLRKEAVVSVPTQVMEIVRPGRALDRKSASAIGQLEGTSTIPKSKEQDTAPPNRLIWTNDNLVALQTLLDERDPRTKEYRYRGKVDLVYIDPPFMVNNDFRADNSIDIEIDDEEGVQAQKEPSLVEILAYKDTWREGLDSFLSMLRQRLVLLKQLLAPTGSIYVHLDWHAVHYVKVMMDEIFGYENFRNEIVWKRTNARSGGDTWPRVHDTILVFGGPKTGPIETMLTWGDPSQTPHTLITGSDGRKYQTYELTGPGLTKDGESGKPWKGFNPSDFGRHWANKHSLMNEWDSLGLIHWPKKDGFPRRRGAEPFSIESRFVAISDIWTDIDRLNQAADDRFGYPTQKPVSLIERVISASSSLGGLVLDCFMGSGTTAEAAERLGRRWIGIDCSKYAVHLARKRLIQLHDQSKPPEKDKYDYIECEHCKNIKRKEKKQGSPGKFQVRPFTVENMGVYQRAAEWQGFQTERSRYRDELVKVFGGEPVDGYRYLHGKKEKAWVHVGPLDGAISSSQVWVIAREAAQTDIKAVTILSADFDTLSASEKEEVKKQLGVMVTIRVIPANAIDEVRRRIELQRDKPEDVLESMTIPAFYAPLSIELQPSEKGRFVTLTLKKCEIDVDSFLKSQKPIIKNITATTTEANKKKLKAEQKKWDAREETLKRWLAQTMTWQKFIDFWAIDWNYGHRVGEDEKPIFETEWQSFRVRRSKTEVESLSFKAEYTYTQPGKYRIAARVTDVFGNDGLATVDVGVK